MLEIGSVLDETYEITEVVGSGGGGIVYKAMHLRMGRYVAIKQIRDRVKGILEDRAEVDILKDLKSDYLPQVYDFLEIDGEIYTVMEFISGNSLAQEMKNRRFTQKEVLHFTKQLAEALALLHSQDPPIIHSDIKPGNIMLTPEGNICLIDFNISLVISKEARRFVGISAGYSPPEQFRDYPNYRARVERMRAERMQAEQEKTVVDTGGAVLDDRTELDTVVGRRAQKANSEIEETIASVAGLGVDERSDIYALGATIYHMLTGIRPSLDFEEITPVRSLDIDISEGFALILEKMLALDPKDRYANGGELLQALNHIRELDSDYKAYRRGRRVRNTLVFLVFLAGLATAGAGMVTMYRENLTVYNEKIESAEALIAEGAYEEASSVIADAIERDPEQIEAYEKEVLRLYTMGDYEGLISYARQIVANGSYVVENETDEMLLADIFYLMGNAYTELEDYTNAVYYFTLALGYNTENVYYYRDYAIALAKNGNLDAAEQALERAVKLGLAQDSISMTQGEVAYAGGDYEAAVEYLTDVIGATSDSDVLRRCVLLCAEAYQQLGGEYLSEEIALLEEMQSRFGSQVSMQITQMLGEAYVSMAETGTDPDTYYEKALAIFQELYEKGYATRQIMEDIAVLYEETDRFDEAADMLALMAESYPDDYRTYKRLALLEADIQQELEVESRDYSEFTAYYEKAEELYEAAGGSGDEEMQMLEVLMQDLADAGWI